MGETVSTVLETIVRGSRLQRGSVSDFFGLQYGPPEPLLVRRDLLSEDGDGQASKDVTGLQRDHGGVSLFRFVHLTDVQFADVKSPTRFEFVNRFAGEEEFALFIPGHRPQELLVASALCAMTSSINALGPSDRTGRALDLVITTGDLIDNAQENELATVVNILSGGEVRVNTGLVDDRSLVQVAPFGDEWYWHPETGEDLYSTARGYPVVPNLITEALRDTVSTGLSIPWIACNGNHEVLVGGMGRVTRGVRELTTGSRKAVMAPSSVTLGASDEFHVSPERFLSMAPFRRVPSDQARQHLDLRGVIARYRSAPGLPVGHGFTEENVAEGRAYYVFDPVAGVRVLALDTAHSGGGARGFVDLAQMRWLERELEVAATSGRYVVVISHHPSTEIEEAAIGSDEVGVSAEELIALLATSPNVVLWLNGHTHRNRVLAHRDPLVPGSGLWEVTSSSIADWPCQVRAIELVDCEDRLEIVCEMIDHGAPLVPRGVETVFDLASWHRLIASNSGPSDALERKRGSLLDRNVRLVVPRRASAR